MIQPAWAMMRKSGGEHVAPPSDGHACFVVLFEVGDDEHGSDAGAGVGDGEEVSAAQRLAARKSATLRV